MDGAQRLTAQGIDLDGYTMLEVIEDNELVRSVLGYERLNLLSVSYGTRVAYLYGLKHPERISRSAMIGVNPPGHFIWEPKVIDAQLKRYSTLWSRDSTMRLRSKDLYADMQTVLNNMPHTWLGFPINPGKVKVVTFALLYHRKTAAMVFDAYVAAAHGDAGGLALMSLASDFVMPSLMTWGDLASKGVCADFDSSRNYCTGMDSSGTPLGSPMGKLLWCPLSYGRWPVHLMPEEFRKVRQSDVHTLLISGSIDFSTPAENASKELLPYLKNGKQIIFAEYGHVNDILHLNTENIRRILTSFYNTGVPDTSLNSYIPMDFNVRWGFPILAKIVLCIVVLVLAVFAAALIWLIKKYYRWKSAALRTHITVSS